MSDYNSRLYERMIQLETKVEMLQKENVELTNALYEAENRLQTEIDKINPPTYNMSDYSLGEK